MQCLEELAARERASVGAGGSDKSSVGVHSIWGGDSAAPSGIHALLVEARRSIDCTARQSHKLKLVAAAGAGSAIVHASLC